MKYLVKLGNRYQIEDRSAAPQEGAPLPPNMLSEKAAWLYIENGEVKIDQDKKTQELERMAQEAVDRDKRERINAEYFSCDYDLYNEAKATYGTSNDIAALADYETVKLMVQSPQSFIGKNVRARVDIPPYYIKGQPLDTIDKLTEYGSLMMQRISEFAVYRMERIAQRDAAVAAIESE